MRTPDWAAWIALLLSTGAGPDARAADVTGLWWNPQESGSAVSLMQQGDSLFVSLLIHSQDGRPTWYMGSNVTRGANDGSGLSFSGPLHHVTGPPPASSFESQRVAVAPVGSVSLRFELGTTGEARSARLEYSVSGATVAKSLTPYTFRAAHPVRGVFFGAIAPVSEGCVGLPQPVDMRFVLEVRNKSANEGGAPIRLFAGSTESFCDFQASEQTVGRFIEWEGTYACFTEVGRKPLTAGAFRIGQVAKAGGGFTGEGWVAPSDLSCKASFRLAAGQLR